jgi:hypothetical protein
MSPPVADGDGLVNLPLITGPDAAATHDALGKIPDYHAVIILIVIRGIWGIGESRSGNLVTIGQGLEFADTAGLADEAIMTA